MTTVPMVNIGKMKSWGFDGSLEYHDKIGQVNVTGRGTFTYANNEILRNGDALNKYPWMNSVGQKIYQSSDLPSLLSEIRYYFCNRKKKEPQQSPLQK